MENFLLITIIGVLLLYFFSSTNVYKSLYKKIKEEKEITDDEGKKLQDLIDKYEKQLKVSSGALKNNQESLEIARKDLQELRLENMDLKHKVDTLTARNEELYAQVNTMV